jgi:hypothetical protein
MDDAAAHGGKKVAAAVVTAAWGGLAGRAAAAAAEALAALAAQYRQSDLNQPYLVGSYTRHAASRAPITARGDMFLESRICFLDDAHTTTRNSSS